MTFKEDMRRIKAEVRARERKLFWACVRHAFRSIRFGSLVTGAPGQPVDTGALLASWQLRMAGDRRARMFSPLFYAPIIEDNFRGAQLRSKVGGFHSVKLTALGWARIVAYELAEIRSTGGDATPIKDAMAGSSFKPRPMRDRNGRFMRGTNTDVDIRGR